jgi:ribosomal protein S18 acetylase RimI-like enzyme
VDAIDVYAEAFVAPGAHELSRPAVVSVPGLRGVFFNRLLVTDDSGYDRLVEVIDGRGVVMVFEGAWRSHELLCNRPGWAAGEAQLAMVLTTIDDGTPSALPDGLALRPVEGPAFHDVLTVPLEDAIAVAVASDPSIEDPAGAAAYFGALPPSARLFAAVDASGVAHATSACHVFGEYAQIFFVNTEPTWRRRGVGQAMTFEALRAAAAAGARRAFLHATEDAVSIYERLGFEPVGMVSRYAFADPSH